MADTTGIAWTRSTLLPEAFAPLQLALVANAVRLVVAQFMTWVAKGGAVIHVVGQFRVCRHRLFMVRTQIAAMIIAAVTAFVAVSGKYRVTPFNVFRRATDSKMPLLAPVGISVVVRTSWCAFFCDPAYSRLCFFRVFFSEPVGWPTFRRFTHFPPRFGTHFGAFTHG